MKSTFEQNLWLIVESNDAPSFRLHVSDPGDPDASLIRRGGSDIPACVGDEVFVLCARYSLRDETVNVRDQLMPIVALLNPMKKWDPESGPPIQVTNSPAVINRVEFGLTFTDWFSVPVVVQP